jgi:hypothetical protein
MIEDANGFEAARRWCRLYRGLYIAPGVPISPRAATRAATLAGAPHAAASHRTGSALFDLPRGDAGLAEIVSPR